MRTTLVFCLVVLASFQVLVSASTCDGSEGQNHNASWGVRQYGDRMVYMDNVKMESKFLRKQSMDLVYPKAGQPQYFTITRIELIDKNNDGKGGCGYIANGGVGQNSVKIHLKTQRSLGMDFTVMIYGL